MSSESDGNPGTGTAPLSVVDMAQFIALRVAACIGADYSNFAMLDRSDGRTLRVFHSEFLDSSIAQRYAEFDIDAPFPLAVAVRTGTTVVLQGHDDYERHFPGMWSDTVAAGVTSTVSLPLVRVDGTAIGALGFAWSVAPLFDVALDRALLALGQLCTEIVERSELYRAEHQLVADLHRRLLSAVPEVDGIVTAARYVAADETTLVGGDWYEGTVLGQGELALVVGDVAGHGLAAAADMALIRGLITAFLADGVDAADALDRVSNILMRRGDDSFATVALVIVDPTDATLTYATAGHPPPLLVQPNGTVDLLDQANGPMLGVPGPRPVPVRRDFPIGARLGMFTDGLVEHRDRTFDRGIADMVAVLTSSDGRLPPEDLITILLDRLVGGGHRDDIAVLVADHVSTD